MRRLVPVIGSFYLDKPNSSSKFYICNNGWDQLTKECQVSWYLSGGSKTGWLILIRSTNKMESIQDQSLSLNWSIIHSLHSTIGNLKRHIQITSLLKLVGTDFSLRSVGYFFLKDMEEFNLKDGIFR